MSRLDVFKKIVLDYYHENVEGGKTVTEDNVFVVWSCKTLQNYKAIIAVAFADERLFEITYNGDKCETYVDVYEKKDKRVIAG
jgi:hypothetical protein